MSYVEHCDTHGQYHGDYCGECVDATQVELEHCRSQLLLSDGNGLKWMEEAVKLREENVELKMAVKYADGFINGTVSLGTAQFWIKKVLGTDGAS